ncbi:hypothetical protein OIV83_001589 [Microbotryomycetes sp. JL201]|nr:hypothetical protein OIV83_001589 [Microbotryomycetes sp. JL201]
MSSDDEPVCISYNQLTSGNLDDLSPLILRAFSSSPSSLGLLLIKDLPRSFTQQRQTLLNFANTFAGLPEHVREQCADEQSGYMFGWSCGKEAMASGKPDTLKGSYYANPTYDVEHEPTQDGRSTGKNVWPDEIAHPSLRGFRQAFRELCAFMVDVGKLVAQACEPLVRGQGQDLANEKTVEALLAQSRVHKARLLHYFNPPGQVFRVPPSLDRAEEDASDELIDDSWCGTHIDHSLLTVLCPSMYLFHPEDDVFEPIVIPSPSESTGLFIKTRAGRTVKAIIPENCLALQTGETLQLLSDNTLAATPHFVNAAAKRLGRNAVQAIHAQRDNSEAWRTVERGTVTRETLAVFLQPNHDEVVSKTGETFGQFSERVHQRHYQRD